MDLESWSEWFNTDNPSHGIGDLETPTLIRKRLGVSVCPRGEPIHAQCQAGAVTFTGQSQFDDLTTPCSRFGVECYNEAQTLGLCTDYRIRFLCRPVEGLVEDDGLVTETAQFFDARYYILLALIPCCVFLLRLVWSCGHRRWKRRLEERRGSADSSSCSGSSSMDGGESTSTPVPPPSYDDLFEDPDGVFFICGGPNNGPVYSCPECERRACTVFTACNRRLSALHAATIAAAAAATATAAAATSAGAGVARAGSARRIDDQSRTSNMRRTSSTSQFRPRNEGCGQSSRVGRRASVIMRRIRSSGSFLASLPRPASCSQLDLSAAARAERHEDSVVLTIPDDDDNVFDTQSSGCGGGGGGGRWHGQQAVEVSTQDAASVAMHRSPSGISLASSLVSASGQSARPSGVKPCTCFCHKSNYSNEAFVQDEPPAYSNSRAAAYGPPSIHRNVSATSLPSYEQALEILKQEESDE